MPRMTFDFWDTFFNLFLLAFWVHLWTGNGAEILLNPYLASLRRMTNSVIQFLRPAFLVLPDRAIAVVALLMLLGLRAFSAPRIDSGWVLHLGFEWAQPVETKLTSYLIFSLLSIAIFLFKIWGLSLIFLRTEAGHDHHSPLGALHAVSRPFVDIPYVWRPMALLVFGLGIALVLNLAGLPTIRHPHPDVQNAWNAAGAGSGAIVVRSLISTLCGWVDILGLLVQLMLLLIIGSWVGLLTGAQGLAMACREGTDLLLGPLRRYPLRIGPLDLSPIVFMIGIGFLQGILHGALYSSYVRAAGGAW